MRLKKNKNFIYIFVYLILSLLEFNSAFSETLKSFDIKGNDRVSNETVIMFSELEVGQNINTSLLNNTIKTLYKTNYFKKVNLIINNGKLEIFVVENPIIQTIHIRGIKDKDVYNQLKEITKKEEKYPFIENKIKNQVTLLNNIVRAFGYYFAEIETKVESNDNNTVNLIYNINLGKIAKIKKITFIGNKIFKDNTLRNVIVSEESKFWKFLTRNKFLDANRINVDVSRLNDFYKNKGYLLPTIKSS